MSNTPANEAMKELTMLLMYLSRFTQSRGRAECGDYFAWKGFDFDVIKELDSEDLIRQGAHPSRTKSVCLTDSGLDYAKKLMEKYGIQDRE